MAEVGVVRPRRTAEVLCAAGLALGTAASLALAAATPALLASHAVLLEALTSSVPATVSGGALARVGRAPLLLVVLAPLAGVLLADVFFFWAGRLWGERAVLALGRSRPRARRWVERADVWVRRHGVGVLAVAYFLPVPNPVVYAACGTAGMPLAGFVLGDAVGTLLWTGLLVGLGWALGERGAAVVDAVDHGQTVVAVVLVALLVLVQLWRRRR